MLEQFLLRQAHVGIHLAEDVLLSAGENNGRESPDESERDVDAVHRHPVDLSLPALPAPPHVAVSERAHVHVVAVLIEHLRVKGRRQAHLLAEGLLHDGQGVWNRNVISFPSLTP